MHAILAINGGKNGRRDAISISERHLFLRDNINFFRLRLSRLSSRIFRIYIFNFASSKRERGQSFIATSPRSILDLIGRQQSSDQLGELDELASVRMPFSAWCRKIESK